MIAQLKYGSGTPFYRVWNNFKVSWGFRYRRRRNAEVVEEGAELLKPARDELRPAGSAG